MQFIRNRRCYIGWGRLTWSPSWNGLSRGKDRKKISLQLYCPIRIYVRLYLDPRLYVRQSLCMCARVLCRFYFMARNKIFTTEFGNSNFDARAYITSFKRTRSLDIVLSWKELPDHFFVLKILIYTIGSGIFYTRIPCLS